MRVELAISTMPHQTMKWTHSHHVSTGLTTIVIVCACIFSTTLMPSFIKGLDVTKRDVLQVCLTVIVFQFIRRASIRWWKVGNAGAMYGLQHGRLHLQAPPAMWMNMGYWKDLTTITTMSEACRNLLSALLAEAGFSAGSEHGKRRTRCLIDLGIGCGDQTIYLMSSRPIRPSDGTWWDAREHCVKFDYYVGITKDKSQACYAFERITELSRRFSGKECHGMDVSERPVVRIFCADAASPGSWNDELCASLQHSREKTQECWVLALDTAYHFAPSRWHLIDHVHQHLDASFMAFDLCISPTATAGQRYMLRILTTLLGAPWCNFMTPIKYRARLVQAGYHDTMISMVDISEYVFTPLADFLDAQDKRLAVLGLGIGALGFAKYMFAWWGRAGVVRAILVVARHQKTKILRLSYTKLWCKVETGNDTNS